MKNLWKNFLVILLLLMGASALFSLFSDPFSAPEEISLTQLAADIREEKIELIEATGNKLSISYRDGSKASAVKEPDAALSETLRNYGVEAGDLAGTDLRSRETTDAMTWISIASLILLPILVIGSFLWMMFRQARGGITQAFDFTKTKARLFGAEGQPKEKVTFDDVAGLKEAKEEVQEVVDFLKNPKKYLRMGARIPRGVLLVGSPGTGKTLLARAVANEAGVPFFSASGSEFIEMFVGVGSSRVRSLFDTAKKAGRSIIFIDELDAIGRQRGSGFGGGHDEREQTLNQILVEMDGFERTDATIIMAATNRPDVLDPALLRPGRFDRRIMLDLPDVGDREQILQIHGKDKPLHEGVSLREIAERTPGFSGADLANLMNEAAIFAARRNKESIGQQELLESIEKVLLGPERRSHVFSGKEKKITAFHEAGHALIAALLPHTDPVRKISIVARGQAGGYTLKLPTEDRYLKSRAEFIDELAVLLGGFAAESMIFGDVTTGASNDLERASELARRLVTEFGMSKKLGPVVYADHDEPGFPGRIWKTGSLHSEKTSAEIDGEIAGLIEDARKTASKILKANKATLDKIAKILIQKETIEREEFEAIVQPLNTKKAR